MLGGNPEGLSVFGGKTGATPGGGLLPDHGEKDAETEQYASVVVRADSRDALGYVDDHGEDRPVAENRRKNT